MWEDVALDCVVVYTEVDVVDAVVLVLLRVLLEAASATLETMLKKVVLDEFLKTVVYVVTEVLVSVRVVVLDELVSVTVVVYVVEDVLTELDVMVDVDVTLVLRAMELELVIVLLLLDVVNGV